jgi:hypothetical protein
MGTKEASRTPARAAVRGRGAGKETPWCSDGSTDNGPVDERAKRVGKNEVLFREVNERLRELGESFTMVTPDSEFVCECGNGSCTEQVRISLEAYEEIRADPKRFILVKSHEDLEFERVLWETEKYLVVEKLPGGPAGIAIRDDPRS